VRRRPPRGRCGPAVAHNGWVKGRAGPRVQPVDGLADALAGRASGERLTDMVRDDRVTAAGWRDHPARGWMAIGGERRCSWDRVGRPAGPPMPGSPGLAETARSPLAPGFGQPGARGQSPLLVTLVEPSRALPSPEPAARRPSHTGGLPARRVTRAKPGTGLLARPGPRRPSRSTNVGPADCCEGPRLSEGRGLAVVAWRVAAAGGPGSPGAGPA